MTEQTTEQLLDSIDKQAEELERTPEQAEQEQAQQIAEQAEAAESQAAAAMLAGVLETVLKLIYPFVKIDDDTREGAAAVLQPLLEKYGVSMGGRYAAELNAVAFFGFAGVGIYQQIAADKARREAEKKAVEDGSKRAE